MVVVLIVASLAVRIWRQMPTRVCLRCRAKVELGKGRCQVCDYQFIN